MKQPKRQRRKAPPADHIVHKDKDLRIPDSTPWDVAQAVMRGGATRRRPKPSP